MLPGCQPGGARGGSFGTPGALSHAPCQGRDLQEPACPGKAAQEPPAPSASSGEGDKAEVIMNRHGFKWWLLGKEPV